MEEEIYIKVGESETDGEQIELPVEKDNTIFLSSLCAQFPGACGLKYRYQESQTMRGLKLVEGTLYLPTQSNNWKNCLYIVVYPKDNKRKMEDEDTNNFRSKRIAQKCTDLIVLGLPWKVQESDLRSYFSSYGELTVTLIKRDSNGKSKGYGFIRFSSYDVQQSVLKKRHLIEGRWCDVKIPHSKEEGNASPKIFVGRITEQMTKEDIKSHFEQYGNVEDVYIPHPFRSFAFVTFADPSVAQSLIGEDQVLKGVSVSINSANPKSTTNPAVPQGGVRNPPNQNNNYPGGITPTFHMPHNTMRSVDGQQNYNNHYDLHQHQTTMNPSAAILNPAVLAAAIGSFSHVVHGMFGSGGGDAGQMIPPTHHHHPPLPPTSQQRGANHHLSSAPSRGGGDASQSATSGGNWRQPRGSLDGNNVGNWNNGK